LKNQLHGEILLCISSKAGLVISVLFPLALVVRERENKSIKVKP